MGSIKINENKMELIHYFERCNECKREILVSVALIGVNHNSAINVVCKECLKKKGIDKRFKDKNPEETKKIEEWLLKDLEN